MGTRPDHFRGRSWVPGLSRPAGFARIAGVSPLRGSLFSGDGTQRLRAGLIYVAAPRLAVSARFEGFLRWCFQIFQPRQSLFSEFFSFTSSPSQLFLLNSFYFLPSSFLLFSVFPFSPSQLFPLSTLPPCSSQSHSPLGGSSCPRVEVNIQKGIKPSRVAVT